MAKIGKDKVIMGIIGAIGVCWVLIMLIGVIAMCGSCVSTGPESDDSQYQAEPAYNYSHQPAKKVTITGSFTERSNNDVRVYESGTGNVEVLFWGDGVAPNVTFSGDENSLVTDIRLDTLSATGQNPTAAYILLPAGPAYDITLENGHGNVSVIHPGLTGTALDVKANSGGIALIRNGFRQTTLEAGGPIAAIFTGGNARYYSSTDSVSLGIASPAGRVVAEAPEGTIEALVLQGTNFTLNATSGSSVTCTIPLNYTLNEKGRVAGATGEGVVLDLSSRGEITVKELQPQ